MPPPSNASPPPATASATAASSSPPPPKPTYPPPARPTPPASSPPMSSSPSPPQNPPSNSPPSTSPPPPPSFTTPIPSPPSGSTPRPPSGRNSPPIPPPEVTSTARSPPSTSSSSTDNSNGISTGSVVGIVIGLGGVILLVILSIIFIRCKSKKGAHSDPPLLPPGPKPLCYSRRVYNWLRGVLTSVSTAPPPEPSRPPTGASLLPPDTDLGFMLRKFTHEQLSSATDGFSESNLLGQGGFGCVYKGVLEDGIEVAVKQLRAGSGQGEREFQTEVEIISRVHHKHLISLVGYCKTETQTIIVYEFVPNNTLEFHLHGKKSTRTLNCSERLKISQGTAKGLAYLHEDCPQAIIHRDIKATNILLDKHFEAKVADFGLAKIITCADAYTNRLIGTFGYMAPEYAASGKLTVKSDVFSFGVVLLELITGRRPVHSNQSFKGNILVDWARPLLTQALKEKRFDALVDPRLPKDYDPNEMARMVACAAACVQNSEWCRPRMSQVVMALEGNIASLSDLNEGMRPGPSSVCSSYGSSDYDTVQHNEDLEKIKLGFSSQEYSGSTGQYSNTTSEYGLNPSVSSSDAEQTREIEMERVKNSGGGKLHGEQLK